MEIEKKYHFYAAHRNKSAGKKCSRLHGHTYDVKIKFKFKKLKNGLTMLFEDIDKICEPIIKQFDHYLILHDKDELCEVFDVINEPYLSVPFETSIENLSIWIFTLIQQELPICQIELQETKTSKFIYYGTSKN